MALSDVTLTAAKLGPPCLTCELLKVLPEADAAQLEGWLSDKTVPYRKIALAIASDDETPIKPGESAITRHATGGCALHKQYRE